MKVVDLLNVVYAPHIIIEELRYPLGRPAECVEHVEYDVDDGLDDDEILNREVDICMPVDAGKTLLIRLKRKEVH